MYKDNTIWTAVFNADENAINRLIDADPNIIMSRGAVGECPIHMLFLYGTDKHLKIARDLIIRFPMIMTQIYNKPKYYGENIFHIAIVKRNLDMVKWLLSDIHSENNRQQLLAATATGDFFKIGQPTYYGETPLAFACCTNQWNISEILLKHGADMNVMDSNGNTILHMLVIRNLRDMYTKFKSYWIEHQAITKSTTVENSILLKPLNLWNRLNKDNLTPLTLAADIGQSDTLSWLLDERKKIQWSYGNLSCVLHPLDQLDVSIQEKDKKHPLCVLEVMIKNNDSKLVNPIIISLIEKKWKHFAYRILIRRFFFTLIYLLIFLATTILEQTRIEMGSVFLENLLSCSFCLCILIVQFLRLFKIRHETVIYAFACLLGWIYMFFFIMPFRFTGPFVIMIYKMLFNDVLRFCIIYIIFLAGFSQSYFVLFNRNGLQGYLSSVKHCFLGLLGDFHLEHYVKEQYLWAGALLFILYVVIITILLLNLLISIE
ncbi:unnamed protein product [Rotaria sp. Silwood1]|nr:unnamed protein product [Rotaria sp. Silwood1]